MDVHPEGTPGRPTADAPLEGLCHCKGDDVEVKGNPPIMVVLLGTCTPLLSWPPQILLAPVPLSLTTSSPRAFLSCPVYLFHLK